MKRAVSLILSILIVLVTAVSSNIVFAEETIMLGDLNSDSVIDMKDMLLMRKRLAKKITNSDISFTNADLNFDNKITILDAMRLISHLDKEKLIVQSNIYSVSALKNCMNLFGRAQLSDDGSSVLLSQTASGFEFTADCEGNLEIYLSTEKECKLNVTIDESYADSYEVDVVNKSKVIIETDLEKGEHTFLIQKATEHAQNDLVEITAISVGGELGKTKPIESEHRIEFYGDSITAGYGNLTTNSTTNAGGWKHQNGCKTYATFTSQNLGADYAIAAASGHGILGGYDSLTQTTDKYWDYTLVGDKTPWSRANYDADLIVINLGTNDDSREGANLDADKFLAKASELVEAIRTENPDVEILWVVGMNTISKSTPLVTALKALDSNYDYVNFYHASSRQNGGDWHPSVADHVYHATNLTAKINELYPNMFK